jgi:cardiolipin synthase
MHTAPIWSHEQLYFESRVYFDALVAEISRARLSVDLEVYIFEVDEIGTKILRSLKDAVVRGVEVRMVLDGFGSFGMIRKLRSELESCGILVKVYHPLASALALNRRDHRKLCIIDGKKVFVGGMNITAEQLHWRDTAVMVEGDAISSFINAYEMHWNKKSRLRNKFGVRLNSSWRQRRKNYWNFISMILHARRRIWITNAYFVPHASLLHALRFAAVAGIDVKVIFPKASLMQPKFMRWIVPAYYSKLIQAGIRVFEYHPSFIHAKTALIDQLAIVGSSNLNHRSLIHDLEIDVHLTRRNSVMELERQFCKDLHECREVTLSDLKRISLFRRILSRLLLLFRYFL